MAPKLYPPAEFINDGVSGGSWVGAPYRVVLHTTETKGLPDYLNGEVTPHLTYDPANRKWWQHNSFLIAARALRNESGGIETNRMNAMQVEIICYSDKGLADSVDGIWVAELTNDQLADIRAFIDWAVDNYGVKLEWPGKQAFNFTEANESGFRMSDSAWEIFDGVCGHQHVPENSHWDPGALDWDTLMAEEEEEEVPLTDADIVKIANAVRVELVQPMGTSPLGRSVWLHKGRFNNDDPLDNAQNTVQRILNAVERVEERQDELEAKLDQLLESEPT